MKKFLILIGLILGLASSASAITYDQIINDLKTAANFMNIQSGDTIIASPILLGHLLQMDNVNAVIHQNQIGGEQTQYYGNLLFEQMKQLPVDEIICSYIGEGVMLSVYARPTENDDLKDKYDMLILYDSANIGLSCALQGQIPAKTYKLLQDITIAYDGYGNIGLYTKMIGFGAHY